MVHADVVESRMRTFLAIVAALLLSGTAAAQKTVSFPTEDGGVVFADVYGTGEKAVVLAHGGRFNKRVGRSRRRYWWRQDFKCWRWISAATASQPVQGSLRPWMRR